MDMQLNHPVAPMRIGEMAPDFTARSTAGPLSLSDFRGQWLVFFSHPADFTPVCTSEFVALARAADRFAALDCALVALSVDRLVRTTFFIDPHGIVRATTSYPITIGRSVDEILRIVAALQATDREHALAPEGWTPGARLLRQPRPTLDAVFGAAQPLDWFMEETEDG